MTPERFAACDHVGALQRGDFRGPIDEGLETLGLMRTVVLVVPSYGAALRMARVTDLVAVVPRSSLHGMSADDGEASSLQSFALPVSLPEIVVSALWHPRMEADPAHRWLRDRVIGFCRSMQP